MWSRWFLAAVAGPAIAVAVLAACSSSGRPGAEAPVVQASDVDEPATPTLGTPLSPPDVSTMSLEDGLQLWLALNTTDLYVTIRELPDPVRAGETFDVVVNPRNDGPNPAEFVRLTITFDPAVEYVGGGSCVQADATTLICEGARYLPALGSSEASIEVLVAPDLADDAVVKVEVQVSHFIDPSRFGREGLLPAPDTDGSNNTTTSEFRVLPGAGS